MNIQSSEGTDYDRRTDNCGNNHNLGYTQKLHYFSLENGQKSWEAHKKIGTKTG